MRRMVIINHRESIWYSRLQYVGLSIASGTRTYTTTHAQFSNDKCTHREINFLPNIKFGRVWILASG